MHALVLLPREELPKAEARTSTTPFERFVSALLRKRTARQTTMAGSAEWTGFPVDRALADGLWVVMLKIASNLRITLSTETQVHGLTPRIGHWINAGILIVHGTPEAAAEAFEAKVIATVEQRLAQADGALSSVSEVWQVASAGFFAELIKASDAFGREFEAQVHAFRKRNFMQPGDETSLAYMDDPGRFDFLRISESLQMARYNPDLMEVEPADHKKKDKDSSVVIWNSKKYHRVLGDFVWLKQQYELQDVFRRIPFRLDRIPPDTYWERSYLGDRWLKTQLLLSAICAPDSDFIQHEEYLTAHGALLKQDDAPLLAAVFRRLEARKVRLTPSERESLSQMLELSLKELRRRKLKGRVGSIEQAETMLVIPADMAHLGHEQALQYFTSFEPIATPTDLPPGATAGMEAFKAKDERVKEKVLERLTWAQVTAQEIAAMLETGLVALETIVANVPRLSERERPAAVELLLAQDELDERMVEALYEAGPKLFTESVLYRHANLLPPKVAARVFPGLLVRENDRHALIVALRLDRAELRRVFRSPKNRRMGKAFLCEVFTDPFQDDLYAALRTKLGHELALRYALTLEIGLREEEYARPDSQRDSDWKPCVSWERLADPGAMDILCWGLTAVVGLDRATIERRLKTDCSEERIFGWLYEGDRNLVHRLAKYLAARDAYFAATASPR